MIPTSTTQSSTLTVDWRRRLLRTTSSTTYNTSTNNTCSLKIRQIPVKTLKDDHPSGTTLYTFDVEKDDTTTTKRTWKTIQNGFSAVADESDDKESSSSPPLLHSKLQKISKDNAPLKLLLPAQYPKSVAPGYFEFVAFCFSASVAGSAAMVLSTQTLLLAVGIVGQHTAASTSGIMAGALNWIIKDFMGQLGGVVFASQMGASRQFDSDPKRWRMVAAMALDFSTLLEILSPLFAASLILPVASIANIGKNIGFLTASASRAALHQSLAITGNLGDVTAKAGSQAIMASLIGTSLGIGLSSCVLNHDTLNFAMGFFVLSIIHQGCNYLSLQYVPLAHFNRQRLGLVLDDFVTNDNNTNNNSSNDNDGVSVLSPSDVSKVETFFPLSSSDSLKTKEWLSIGRPLEQVCPDPNELETLLKLAPKDSQYLLSIDDNGKQPRIDVIYFKDATGEGVIRGVYHAWMARKSLQSVESSCDKAEVVQSTYHQVEETFPTFLENLRQQGWNTSMDVTSIESSSSCRIDVER